MLRLLRLAKRPMGWPRPRVRLDGAALARVIDYMHAHLGDKLALGELIDVAPMSRFRFARLFKDATGTPPHEYVIGLRVKRAKESVALSALS